MITNIHIYLESRKCEYKYEIEGKDRGIFKGTKDEAIEEIKSVMFKKYNRVDESPAIKYKVKKIIITRTFGRVLNWRQRLK